MAKLEDYLANKPLNEDIARLMRGEEPEEETQELQPQNYADGAPVTDADRAALKRMMGMRGWQVLLKLLDTSLQHQEDAARRLSLEDPTGSAVPKAWLTISADKHARDKLLVLAKMEVDKLDAKAKKNKCDSGTTKTATATN